MDSFSMPHQPQRGIVGSIFAAVAGVSAGLIMLGGLAAADTQNWDAKVQLQEQRLGLSLLGEDRSAFAENAAFRRIARFPTTNVAIDLRQNTATDDGETREALAALTAEDAETAVDMITEELKTAGLLK